MSFSFRESDPYGKYHKGSLLQVVRRSFYHHWTDYFRMVFEIGLVIATAVFFVRLMKRMRHTAQRTGKTFRAGPRACSYHVPGARVCVSEALGVRAPNSP